MKTIYVQLLDEGTKVFRPVNATLVKNNIYKISIENKPGDESWEFAPGSYVIVEESVLSRENVLIAVKEHIESPI